MSIQSKNINDWRNIVSGYEIPSENYCDQPDLVKTDDGAWLCMMTTGSGTEGQTGQHIVAMRSNDLGRTWSEPVDVEPSDGPEASYSVLLKASYGRLYCFYNYNTDNIRSIKADICDWFPDGLCKRVDSMGYFVFKYSDDNGRTWSDKRYIVPVREFGIDKQNPYKGKTRYFWNVGSTFTIEGAAYVPLHKVGGFGEGFFTKSEGALLKSKNILAETDPERILWDTLPDGDVGLRTPPGGGPIAEEQSFCVLSDQSIFCVYRSVDGHPVYSYSRDGGHTWDEPKYMRYADGRLINHPRAANFVWRCRNGKYLYWFHNHGGKDYKDRNPVWVCGGVEEDTLKGRAIKWTQPEIMLYDDNPNTRISYPYMIEDEGRLFISETQKNIARIHEIDRRFLNVLWEQFNNNCVCTRNLIKEKCIIDGSESAKIEMPNLPVFLSKDDRENSNIEIKKNGFTVDLWIKVPNEVVNSIIADSRTSEGAGLCLQWVDNGRIEAIISDGRSENRWQSDLGMIRLNELNHVAVIVDGGPRIITFVINGKINDGGDARQFGWGRFSPNQRHANGSKEMIINGRYTQVVSISFYSDALMISEVIGNYRAGRKKLYIGECYEEKN